MNTKRAGFSQQVRLKKPAEFERVFLQVEQRSSDQLLTILSRSNDLGFARLGLAVAKKRVRLAVGRNRVKRLARETFRHAQHDMPPIDCIVLAKPQAATADNAALSKSLRKHWQRLARRYAEHNSPTAKAKTRG